MSGDSSLDWNKANQFCLSHGAKLIRIESEVKQEALERQLEQGYGYWTAGTWNQRIDFSWNNGDTIYWPICQYANMPI